MKSPLVLLGMTVVSFVAGSSPKIERNASPAIDTNRVQEPIEVPTSPTPLNKACGIATYYDLSGITANGETYNPKALTAAHPNLPFNSIVRIEDQHTGLSVKVRINDRGPWVHGYMLDLSPAAKKAIDPKNTSDLRQVCMYW